MTAMQCTVIRACVRALQGGEPNTMDALAVSYGIAYHANRPVKDRAAALLEVLVNDDNS